MVFTFNNIIAVLFSFLDEFGNKKRNKELPDPPKYKKDKKKKKDKDKDSLIEVRHYNSRLSAAVHVFTSSNAVPSSVVGYE